MRLRDWQDDRRNHPGEFRVSTVKLEFKFRVGGMGRFVDRGRQLSR